MTEMFCKKSYKHGISFVSGVECKASLPSRKISTFYKKTNLVVVTLSNKSKVYQINVNIEVKVVFLGSEYCKHCVNVCIV